jgi:hypothetical protein
MKKNKNGIYLSGPIEASSDPNYHLEQELYIVIHKGI